MNEFPGQESGLLRWVGKMGTFLGLSVLWILLCLPLLTIIPACVALYDGVVYCVRGDEPGPYRRFFATLKAELGRGILLSVLWIVVVLLAVVGFLILSNVGMENTLFSIYTMVYAGTMLIPLAMLTWVIPLQARFRYGFFELHHAALSFAILHLPTTALVMGLLLVAALVALVMPVLLLLIPAILVTVQAKFIEKVLVQYEDEELTADEEE